LIAYDGADAARSAICAAAGLLPDAEAVVLHVYDPPPGPERAFAAGAVPNEPLKESFESLEREFAEQAEAVAEEGRALAAEAGLVAESAIVPSRRAAWHAILSEAARQETDLLVGGTRGQGPVGRAVLGSTSSSLVHQADRPVMIVPAGEHEMSGPVVLAYDGSNDARSAIATLGRLMPGRETVVVHAWTWPLTEAVSEQAVLTLPAAGYSEIVEALERAAIQAARQVAQEGCDLAARHGLSARMELRESTEGTWRALVAAATDLHAAAAVAGSRGLGGLKSVLLGSVSTALAHHADRPTLIVQPADLPASRATPRLR
jgi:nucleotide-binding universal stress UspA family protein